jgi:outer membrane protein OmpA-like peptidoglycan-associated protein
MIFIKEKSMKNLFELSEEEKNSIRGLHESYKSKPGTKLIWEQTEDVTLNKLNEKIKNVLLSNKNKVYQNVTVTISPKGNGMSLEFASQTNPNNTSIIDVPASGVGVFEKNVSNFNVTFKTLKLSEVYSEIFDNDPTLNQLYNNDNSVKSQMDNAFVPLYIYSENNGRISASNNENNRKNRKSNKFVEGDVTTLDKFYNNAGADFGVGNSIISVGFGGFISDLGKIKIKKTGPVPPPEPPPVANSFDFELENSFIFDTIDLYPESLEKYNQKKKQLQTFLEMVIKSQLNNTKNTSIAEILNTNVIIEGYASIDGDPNENISKAEKLYEPCRGSGKGTRKDYNLCLSQKRAEYIANDLNNFIGPIKFPDGRTISGAFPNGFKNWAVGVGKGETTQFVDKKWPNTKNTDETAPNRRIVFTPKLVANIKE